MAILKMQKISIVGLCSEKNKVLDYLQNRSDIEISECCEKEKESYEKIIGENTYFTGKEKLEFDLAELKYTIDFVEKYYTGPKPGLLESFIGNKINVDKKTLVTSKNLDYKKIVEKIKQIDSDLNTNSSKRENLKNQLESLGIFKDIKINFKKLTDLENYSFQIGKTTKANHQILLSDLGKITKLISVENFLDTEREKFSVILYPKSLTEETKQKITKSLADNKFVSIDSLHKYELSPNLIYKELTQKLEENKKQNKDLLKQINYIVEKRLELMCAYDRLNWQLVKMENLSKSVKTNSSYILSAWAAKKHIKQLKQELSKISPNTELIETKPEKNDTPPTILDNPGWAKPFEAVVNIYGMPKYSEPDPTMYLAIFFIIFLALCLTDAGYGIIMILATWLMLKKVDLPDTRLVKLLHYGGWVTLVIGALTGGWFGIDLNSLVGNPIADFFISIRLIDPINDPITLMLVSLALGILHIWFGLFIKFNFKRTQPGKSKEAWLDDFPWVYTLAVIMIFLVGQAVTSSTFSTISNYILYSAVALIALTQGRDQKIFFLKPIMGIFKLYDLVGYVSDTLSYSRLLALGLATAIIGLVVNMIASIFGQVPYVGFVLMGAILIGGHLFNLSINLLGAFIHSARLQYVEFFTKFLEGGGKRFDPLAKQNVYTNIKN